MEKKTTATLAFIMAILLGVFIGYMIWVGIIALVNLVFGLTLPIWWGGLLGVIGINLLRAVFKR